MMGMPHCVASAARWKLSYMSAHAVGVFGDGAEPPPDRIEPTRKVVTSAVLMAARSACVIWPTLSAKDIRGSRSATRAAGLNDGSWYGNAKVAAVAARTVANAANGTSSASSGIRTRTRRCERALRGRKDIDKLPAVNDRRIGRGRPTHPSVGTHAASGLLATFRAR